MVNNFSMFIWYIFKIKQLTWIIGLDSLYLFLSGKKRIQHILYYKHIYGLFFSVDFSFLITTKMFNIQMFWYLIWKASIICKFHSSGQLPLSLKYDQYV